MGGGVVIEGWTKRNGHGASVITVAASEVTTLRALRDEILASVDLNKDTRAQLDLKNGRIRALNAAIGLLHTVKDGITSSVPAVQQ